MPPKQTSGSNAPGGDSGEIESFTGEGRGGTLEEALMIKLSELITTVNAAHGIDLSQAESLLIYVGLPSHLSDDEDVQRARRQLEDQLSLLRFHPLPLSPKASKPSAVTAEGGIEAS